MDEATPSATRKLIPARIDETWLTFDADLVQEITAGRAWMPVPRASALVPGVVAWRGRAVAVLDLAALAEAGPGRREARGQPRHRTVIAESSDCFLAMPVDVVHEVQDVDLARVRAREASAFPHAPTEVEMFGTFAAIVDLPSLVRAVFEEGALGGHDPEEPSR
jgi:chemotaxis signal transduction protein